MAKVAFKKGFNEFFQDFKRRQLSHFYGYNTISRWLLLFYQ